MHQPLRGDDATLLQHAYIQEFDRELPGRGHPVRRGGRLRRQRALYRPHLIPGIIIRSFQSRLEIETILHLHFIAEDRIVEHVGRGMLDTGHG